MANRITAYILLLLTPICLAEQSPNKTICLVFYSHNETQTHSNDISTAITNKIQHTKARHNNSYTSHCSNNSLAKLSAELESNNIAHNIQTHTIPVQKDSLTTIPAHICYDKLDSKQCIDYEITLSQGQQQELELRTNIYQLLSDNTITNLHSFSRLRRLKAKQTHYIDDQDIGILILHNIT